MEGIRAAVLAKEPMRGRERRNRRSQASDVGQSGSVVGQGQMESARDEGSDIVDERGQSRQGSHQHDVDDGDDEAGRHDSAEAEDSDDLLGRLRAGNFTDRRLQTAHDAGGLEDDPENDEGHDGGDADGNGHEERHLHDRPRVNRRHGEADRSRALLLFVALAAVDHVLDAHFHAAGAGANGVGRGSHRRGGLATSRGLLR